MHSIIKSDDYFLFTLQENMKKFQNILAFYRSTLVTNIAISIFPLIFINIETFLLVFTTFGYIFSIAILEVHKKENYLFYFNNKLTKLQLIFFGMVLNFILAFLIAFINVIITKII